MSETQDQQQLSALTLANLEAMADEPTSDIWQLSMPCRHTGNEDDRCCFQIKVEGSDQCLPRCYSGYVNDYNS